MRIYLLLIIYLISKSFEKLHLNLVEAGVVEASGSRVEVEPRGQWSAAQGDVEDTSRPRRGDLKVIGGAGLGSSASVYDVSIASPYHTTRVQSLASTSHTRHECARLQVQLNETGVSVNACECLWAIVIKYFDLI